MDIATLIATATFVLGAEWVHGTGKRSGAEAGWPSRPRCFFNQCRGPVCRSEPASPRYGSEVEVD